MEKTSTMDRERREKKGGKGEKRKGGKEMENRKGNEGARKGWVERR